MINDAIGARRIVDGVEAIETWPGRLGHAVFGPYLPVGAGTYVAEVRLKRLNPSEGLRLCAVVEVVADRGAVVFGRVPVFSPQIDASERYELMFKIDRPVQNLEIRVWVNGSAQLLVFDDCRIRDAANASAPNLPVPAKSKFLQNNALDVYRLFFKGFGIHEVEDELIIEHSGVSLHARTFDDIRFLEEIFVSRVYNFLPFGSSVLIDVGMNIGATSLLLAQNPLFEEIHAFEPFPTTYRRATENLTLNPQASAKIRAHNFGLSDHDETLNGFFDPADSGMSSTAMTGRGEHTESAMVKDGAQTLAPIFRCAEESGRRIFMKIDCEGSEFALFRTLARAGLMNKITAMAVEWHRGFGSRDEELIAPLAQHGFVVVDRDPPAGNGFFYAARAA